MSVQNATGERLRGASAGERGGDRRVDAVGDHHQQVASAQRHRGGPDARHPVAEHAAEDQRDLLPQLCLGCASFDDLRKAPILKLLKSQLLPHQLAAIDREAPERIDVPSGNRIALTYERGKPPVLAVRIQEVFGMKETPRVAGGRVAVLLHLLAPNRRPQQVTSDLASFWKNTYPIVRGELRRRYPKHAWPENPYTATAERRPGRKPI